MARFGPRGHIDTHPSPAKINRIVKMWHSSFSGSEIAAMENIKPITVYKRWQLAKSKGLLPKPRRPNFGF